MNIKEIESLRQSNKLLEEYSKSLERENEAKNIETAKLYDRISSLTEENEKHINENYQLRQRV